jgi:uncharacterized Tic20 family protein
MVAQCSGQDAAGSYDEAVRYRSINPTPDMNSLNSTAVAPDGPPVAHAPAGNEKIWSILSHLSAILGVGIVLPLVVYLAMRQESEYVAENAREALNFHISVLIYGLVCVLLLFVVIGFPLLIALGIAAFVLAIIGAVKASNGECYRYPLTLRLV